MPEGQTPPPQTTQPGALSTTELVWMVAALSALNALSIDVMLPALPDIGAAFGLANDNDRQLVVVFYVFAFGLGQLVYGPLSDAFGRKSVLVAALGIYLAGTLLCVMAPSFGVFLAARVLQGLGAAATRVVSTAAVRDLTSGRRMAQIMSMAMTIFMIVPIVAPGIGQLILYAGPWRWIFGALTFYAIAVLLWTMLRLPETLTAQNKRPFNLPSILGGYADVFRNRQALGYMLATTFICGGLFGYVTASEQVFVEGYDLGPGFALAFAGVAVAITIGTFLNTRFVVRLGMRRISHAMSVWFVATALINASLVALGLSNFWQFFLLLSLTMGSFGLIAGNFNALFMEPMGHVAGSASALYGAITAIGGAVMGGLIARYFDGTALPFLIGMAVTGVLTLVCLWWAERGKLFIEAPQSPVAKV